MGSLSSSNSKTQQLSVDASSLESANNFASPESVIANPGGLGVKIDGSLNNVTQNFEGNVGINGQDLIGLVNELMTEDDSDQKALSGMTDTMNATVNSLADKLAAAQQGETGQFSKMLREFGIFIGVLFLAWLLFRNKK